MAKKKKGIQLSFLLVAVLLFTIASFISGFRWAVAIYEYDSVFSLPAAANWGTFIGGFLSIPATILIYVTFRSQQKELKATSKALRLQKIDSAFFSMLSMLENIIQGMSKEMYVPDYSIVPKLRDYGGGDKLKVCSGREYLKEAYLKLKADYKVSLYNFQVDMTTGEFYSSDGTVLKNIDELRDHVGDTFLNFFDDHKSNLSHYFRYVYSIIKFIDQNQLGDFETRRYLSILQAQLSHEELGFLFYDSISAIGKKSNGQYQFADWLDKYDILSNIDPDCVFKPFHYWTHPKANFKYLNETELLERFLNSEKGLKEQRQEYVAKFLK